MSDAKSGAVRRHDIAIIGMAGRFPGAHTLADFWNNIRGGVESIRTLSDDELRAAGVTEEELRDPAYVKACPVLEGVDQFDATFFGMSPRDASVMDPAHRLFLEVAWEAAEDAGYTALPDEGAVGVFAGSGAPYYLMDHVRRDPAVMQMMGEFLVRHTGNDMNFLATRVSYEMDLRGPSLNIQTACSTALVSVHLACESLRRGECAIALAGGSTVILPDRQGYTYREGEILSPDGHCRPFDDKSAGTVFGSGSGCVVLKLLSAALDDGDTVHAVIRGSAINNDGALRVGYLAPGVEGQAAVVRRALDDADAAADSITYIETHGTGTSVGDPIEVTALNEAFRGRTARTHFCAIGSVKSNLGHLGEAAGIASLMKAVLALRHRELPPSLGYESPNRQIDFSESPFFVNDRLRPWEAAGPLRCGVTALGAGGTNCHLILEEAPEPIAGEGARAAQLLLLSAKTTDALAQACENLADAFEAPGAPDLADAAYTLAVGRRAMPHRCAVVARSAEDAAARLRERAGKITEVEPRDDQDIVFMFPGGGAQYPGMGADLYAREPAYRAAIEACFAVLDDDVVRDLRAMMFGAGDAPDAAARALEQPTRSLPSLFATEYALARLFETWGVRPTALLGHSMGEYVSACLAGVFSLDDALRLVMMRARLFESTPPGRMLSVPLTEARLRALLPDGVSIAAVNAPELCTASGSVTAIEALERLLAAQEIESTRIRIDVAAHSALLDPVLAKFGALCRTIAFRPPRIPFQSNLMGRWITAAEATDPEYWVRHLRSTVRFSDNLASLRADGERVLIEIGPGHALSVLARAQIDPMPRIFNSMPRASDPASDLDYALDTLGKAWTAGVPADWAGFYAGQLRNRVELPTYPWQHQRHWIAAATVVSLSTVSESARRGVDAWFARPVWKQTLPPPPITAAEEHVLVFADDLGMADAISSQLAASGRRIWRVLAGEQWARQDDTFTIAPGAAADYERLLGALSKESAIPQRVIHAWGITAASSADPLDHTLDRGFHSLLCFAQALSSEDAEARLALDVLTTGQQRLGGEERVDPAKSLSLGPARVMPQEFPNVSSRSIDISLPAGGHAREALTRLVAADIASVGIDATIAYRGLDRFVQTLEEVSLTSVAQRLRERGVYVITGGFGGIGLTVAEHLARTQHARLVLIGRNAGDARAQTHSAALERLGAEVEIIRADVTDADALQSGLARARSRFGEINGVFHAAGVLGDSLMPFKTREDAERVLAPKVPGTLALDAALGDAPLDLLVLFSSISSIAGLPGQADYTAANAFLDAFARERSARDGTFAVAINWSAWRDVGMAARISGDSAPSAGVAGEIHPLLGRLHWSHGDDRLFASTLSPSSHWVLDEHRLRSGRPLMPGTGMLEIARAALASRPESRALEIRDAAFLSAFAATDGADRELRVRLRGDGRGGHTLAIAGRIGANSATTADGADADDADSGVSWQEHMTASVRYIDDDAPRALDLAAIGARCTRRMESVAGTSHDAHMRFGPRWNVIESGGFGAQEALLQLALPEQYAEDLGATPLHPALLDMATGGAQALAPGCDPRADFYVPLAYGRLRMFAPLQRRVVSHVRLAPSDLDPKEQIVFNVTITDVAGNVLVEIDEFMMTRVTDLARMEGGGTQPGAARMSQMFEPPVAARTPPLLQEMSGAITPGEGIQALERVLAGPALAQIYVSPKPLPELLSALRDPPLSAPPPVARRATAAFPVAKIEAALAEHDAVLECAVVQRAGRPGTVTLVGYFASRPGAGATVTDLRRFLKKKLPVDQVPSTFVELDELPRNASGGVNQDALPDPFAGADRYVAPRTETERAIAKIWEEVLGVTNVSVRDNFFDAGGHSLLAVRVVARIAKTTGVRISQSMMVLQTLEQIAAECDRRIAAPVAADSARPTAEASPGFGRKLFKALRGE